MAIQFADMLRTHLFGCSVKKGRVRQKFGFLVKHRLKDFYMAGISCQNGFVTRITVVG